MMRQKARTAEARLDALLELQSLLARVAHDIGPAVELQPVLSTVLSAMRSLVSFKGGSVCLVDGGVLRVAVSDPPVSREVAAARLPVGSGLAGRAVSSREPVYSPDIGEDPRVDQHLRHLGSNAPIRSYLAVPLVTLGQVIGVMQVDSADVDAFDGEDVQVLEGLATQVAGAIESARRFEAVLELERLKTDFIARVGHELRTPVTIISGFLTTLQGRYSDLDEAQRLHMLDRMHTASTRLECLIEELVTASSFEAGMTEPIPEEVGLGEVLDRVRSDAVHPERVQVRSVPGLRVLADPKLLRHALTLLVDNALKYAGDADLSADVDGVSGQVVVTVADHGPGVPPELRDKIFERFTRGDHTVAGMGLGLPLVATLAAGFGAKVELTDNPGGGARFRLVFA